MSTRDSDVVALIHASAAKFGSRVLLREFSDGSGRSADVARETTYGDLTARARWLAAALYEAGLQRGARVGVLLENSSELVVTEWACLMSGLVWVGLNIRTSAAELQGIVEDCAPHALIHGAGSRDLVAAVSLPANCLCILAAPDDRHWLGVLKSGEAAIRRGLALGGPTPAEPVRIRYTSGTAGKPKGAVLPRRCYDASATAVSDVIGPLTPEDVVIHVAPMTHASGAMLLPHAAVGARSVILRHFDPDALIEVIQRERATAVFLVPTMLVRLLEVLSDRARVASLRTIVYGGAAMPVDRLQRALEILGPIFVQIYGLTESTWPVCALRREHHVRRVDEPESLWLHRLQTCGRPTAVGQVRIVTQEGLDAATREVGELWVRGRNTMTGYWCLPGHSMITDEKGLDREGWMHTGDLGFVDEEGFVTIVDRLHDMIVSGGFNVYPREVETALSSHDAVMEVAVVGRPDPEWGETVHAAVVLRPGRWVTEDELTRHCALVLPGYKKPRSIEIVAALPKNSSGKILRREIRARQSV